MITVKIHPINDPITETNFSNFLKQPLIRAICRACSSLIENLVRNPLIKPVLRHFTYTLWLIANRLPFNLNGKYHLVVLE